MKFRRTLLALSSLAFGLVLSACKSCTEQHNPKPAQEQLMREEANANPPIEKLNSDGTVPAAKALAGSSATAGGVGQAKYEQFCSPCHGVDGAAAGPGSAGLNPKPRNLTDAKWQASVDDAHIAKVIKEGGASVGLSASMAAWGAVLNDDETKEVVKWVRQFKK